MKTAMLRLVCVTVFAWSALLPVAAAAQNQSALRVTVRDETEAVLIHAIVTLIDPSGIEKQTVVDQSGVAAFTGLMPGAHQIKVEAEGFQGFTVPFAVKRGINTAMATMTVAIREEVFVQERDAAARRDNGFTQTLSKDDIDGLSDDPDEMAEQLRQMAGPGAQIFIDGFRGGRLPPKDQIQSIRFHSNSYAAEYHEAGMVRVEVITRPGMGGWRGNFNFGFRDESLNARNAFATEVAPEQHKRFMFTSQGPIAKGKTSLSIAADGNMSYDARTIVATTPTGPINDQVRRPVDSVNANVRLEHALSPTSSIRAEYSRRSDKRQNLGVGDFDLAERAYETEAINDMLRVRNTRTIGRKVFSELRFEVTQSQTLVLLWFDGAHGSRARRLYVRWRRSIGRPGRTAIHSGSELRLYCRQARAAGGFGGGWRLVGQHDADKRQRDVHVLEPRRPSRVTAADLSAPSRRPERQLLTIRGRMVSAGRFPREQERQPESGSPSGSADQYRRQVEPGAARCVHLVDGQGQRSRGLWHFLRLARFERV